MLIKSPAIHGDKQQNERDWVLNEFKTGKSPIMVATDVASRGIGMIDQSTAPVLHSHPFPFPLSPPLPGFLPSCGDLVHAKRCFLPLCDLQLLLVSGPGFVVSSSSLIAGSS